jgi:hypothetical protein
MLKDQERPKETAHAKAKRRWRNHDISTRFKEAQKNPNGANEFPVFDGKKYFATERPKPPKIGETLTNGEKRSGSVHRLESKLTKHIKSLLKGHVDKNLAMYAASLQYQKRRLLLERLRRLEAQQSQGE